MSEELPESEDSAASGASAPEKAAAPGEAKGGKPDPAQAQVQVAARYTLYMRARTLNFLAGIFAVCGFFLFAALYQQHIAPDPLTALRNISTLGIILFPFLPAVILSFMARRSEKRYLSLLDKPQ